MPTHFMEIQYTREDGSTFTELGTHVIAHTDGRHSASRQTATIMQNARAVASTTYPKVTLRGVRRPGDDSGRVHPLPDGSRDIPITPMTPDERRTYRTAGGYLHP